jgi:hypothetical protein
VLDQVGGVADDAWDEDFPAGSLTSRQLRAPILR